MEEKWKTIVFAPKYEVSNMGNIRNAKTKRVLKPVKSKSHKQMQIYLYVGWYAHCQFTISQIVFNHWCVKNGEKWTYYSMNGYKVKNNRIGHKDGDNMNNRADNLFRY